jgi:phosphate transport system substrate-binding protein
MKKIYHFLALAILIATVGCTPIKRGEYASGSTTICCDDGFRKILEEEIEVFEYQYPNGSIIPYYVSESAAVDSLMADRTQLIVITHELDKDQINYIKKKNKRIVRQNCIAVDAVALIVNKNNPVGQLTMSEIQDILLGKITNWNQLAGNDTTKIKLVFDNAGSSTVSYMRNKFLPEGRMISENPNAFGQKNNAQVFDIVKKDKDALGIISVSWLGDNLQATKVPMDKKLESLQNETDTIPNNLTTEINILKVRKDDEITGYKPYQAYINSGEYPLFRKVYMISTGSNSTVAHSFYTFVTGFVGQKIISLTGVMPYHVNQRLVELK